MQCIPPPSGRVGGWKAIRLLDSNTLHNDEMLRMHADLYVHALSMIYCYIVVLEDYFKGVGSINLAIGVCEPINYLPCHKTFQLTDRTSEN